MDNSTTPTAAHAHSAARIAALPIAHTMQVQRSGEVFSQQCLWVPRGWLPAPFRIDEALLHTLGPRYFRRLPQRTRGLIVVRQGGEQVSFALAGLGVPLLHFAPPTLHTHASGGEVRYPIGGGAMLARGAGSDGYLGLSAAIGGQGGLQLCMTVSGYYSRIGGHGTPSGMRRWLYSHTQAALHHWIARDYLRLVARQLIGAAGGDDYAGGYCFT